MNNRANTTKKRSSRLRCTMCVLFCLVMVFCAAVNGVIPSYGADFNIDSSDFKTDTADAKTIYYWHEGMPPQEINGNRYPILITWDDKYFLAADGKEGGIWRYKENEGEFKEETDYKAIGMTERYIMSQYAYLNTPYNTFLSAYGIGKDQWVPGSWMYVNRIIRPALDDIMLSKHLPNLLSDLKEAKKYANSQSNFGSSSFWDALANNGFAATYDCPSLPFALCVEKSPEKNDSLPSIYFEGAIVTGAELKTTTESRWALGFEKGGRYTNDNQWLIGEQAVSAIVFPMYLWSLSRLEDTDTFKMTPEVITDPNRKIPWDPHPADLAPGYNIPIEERTWVFRQDSSDKSKYQIYTYCIHSELGIMQDMLSYSGDPRDKGVQYEDPYTHYYAVLSESTALSRMTNYVRALNAGAPGSAGRMSLCHTGSNIVTYTLLYPPASGSDQFKVYWAEPITLNVFKNKFTVKNGQVANLDGPALLDTSAVYRVKDGGVLTVTDWLINNGTIIIEKGGTLIVQENTDKLGHTRYGTLMSQVSGGDGGRIVCEGTIIIMPNCKVFGGGSYGIQLADGAYVVNYGTIGSENFTCYHDYTIENRSSDSHVFAGYGITGSGFAMTYYKIVDGKYPNQGNRESTYSVWMARNSVYGQGASNLHLSNKVSRTDVTHQPKSGSIADTISFKTIDYVFTADGFYDLTLPFYFEGGQLKSIWLYAGDTITKTTKGEYIINYNGTVGGMMIKRSETYGGDDTIELYKGNPGEQWAQYGYRTGSEIYYGFFSDWTPPAGTVTYPEEE